jgi:hypothetical protein
MIEVAEDQLVPINRAKLKALVEKTPFSMGQFEKLVGWSFFHEAPASKRALAWRVLGLSRHQLDLLCKYQDAFPGLWLSGVEDVDAVLGGIGGLGGPGSAGGS